MDPRTRLLALLAARDAQDTLERAAGWAVDITHAHVNAPGTLYGPFSEPAAALAYAGTLENELNAEGEQGFRAHVRAIMPAHQEEDHGDQ